MLTTELNACNVFILISKYGVIMSHIPPIEHSYPTDKKEGERVVRRMMGEVKERYNTIKAMFPKDSSSTRAIAAIARDENTGKVGMPAIARYIDREMPVDFKRKGVLSVVYYWESIHTPELTRAGKGTVVVDGSAFDRDDNPTARPKIYVETKISILIGNGLR